MATIVRIFIDFWNFQLQWNARSSSASCDWTKLPAVLTAAAQKCAPNLPPHEVHDTRVYASYNPRHEADLRKWLDGFLNRQPGFRVFIRERRSRPKPVHCRACDAEIAACPSCQAPLECPVWM